MSEVLNKSKFLDLTGLSKFWSIIDHKFATKADAVKADTFEITEKNKDTFSISYTDCNNSDTGTGAAQTYSFVLPAATNTEAGLLSADHFQLIDDIENQINDMAPFHGLKLGNDKASATEVNLAGKRASIGLNFDTSGDVGTPDRKAYIELVDLNYPANGTWSTITKELYEANSDKPEYHAYIAKGEDGTETITYHLWSVAGEAGPVNNLGEPITQKALSRIDVTEFVKAGLLASTDVVLREGKLHLKLEFFVGKDGDTKVEYIDVTDLVDIYTAGEGISIGDPTGGDADDQPTSTVISLNAATNSTLGGVKTGYTAVDKNYAIKLDAQNNAYVIVPWNETTVSSESAETDVVTNSKIFNVTVTPETESLGDNKGNNTNYHIQIEPGDGFRHVESVANSAIQTIKLFDNTIVDKTNPDYTKSELVNDAQLGSAIDTNVFSGEINIDPEDTAQNTSTTNFTKNTFKVDEETGEVTIEKTETQTVTFDNVPTVGAVKSYVERYVEATVTDDVVAPIIDAAETAQNETARRFFTKIAIENGKFIDVDAENGSEAAPISINDIYDFRQITIAEIETLCNSGTIPTDPTPGE